MNQISKPAATLLAIAGLASISVAAGCGQAPGVPTVGTGSTTTTTTTTPQSGGTVGSTTSPYGSSPNYDFHFGVTGSGTATQVGGGGLTVATDTLLQVTLTAGDGGQQVGNTGFTAGFNCEKFNIKVGTVTQSVFVAVPGYQDYMFAANGDVDPCYGAPTSFSYDFSSALGTGHTGSVNIIINSAKYDNCRTDNQPDYGGCGSSSLTSVYYTDSVDGYLQVFTD
jgi:hypothetical protein